MADNDTIEFDMNLDSIRAVNSISGGGNVASTDVGSNSFTL